MKGETQFTPGPWKTGREATQQCGDWEIEYSGSCSYKHIAVGDNDTPVALVTVELGDDAVLEANAALIVAAPDLYAVTADAAKTFREYEALHRAKGTPDGDAKAEANRAKAEKCEAALSRARGEAQGAHDS